MFILWSRGDDTDTDTDTKCSLLRFVFCRYAQDNYVARMPEWSKGDDLRSSIVRCAGSNPAPSKVFYKK